MGLYTHGGLILRGGLIYTQGRLILRVGLYSSGQP